jgi:hypothetical protein
MRAKSQAFHKATFEKDVGDIDATPEAARDGFLGRCHVDANFGAKSRSWWNADWASGAAAEPRADLRRSVTICFVEKKRAVALRGPPERKAPNGCQL